MILYFKALTAGTLAALLLVGCTPSTSTPEVPTPTPTATESAFQIPRPLPTEVARYAEQSGHVTRTDQRRVVFTAGTWAAYTRCLGTGNVDYRIYLDSEDAGGVTFECGKEELINTIAISKLGAQDLRIGITKSGAVRAFYVVVAPAPAG